MSDISNINRLTGLASGLDTENMVKQLMNAEKMPLNKLIQKKQLLEWRKDAYRDITNTLRGFREDFFSVLKPGSNILSDSLYYKFTASSTEPKLVTANASAEARPGTHKITVTQLATAGNTSSAAGVSAPLTGAVAAAIDFTDGNNKINITLDGTTKTIALKTDAAYASAADLVSNGTNGLQKLINDAFGAGKISVSVDGSGMLSFASVTGSSRITLNSSASNNALTKLGFANNDSNRIVVGETLENLASKFNVDLTFDASNQLKFNINGVDFTFNKTDTLKSLIDKVNNSSAGVELKYSELTDAFTLTSKRTGTGNNIVISNTGGNFFDANPANSAVRIATGVINNGKDAQFELDGIDVTRSDNSFTIDGVSYSLNEADPLTEVQITVNADVNGVYDNIKAFVDKYNEIIGKINGELLEEKFREYQPLTDAQKEELSDDEVKKWEEKAQKGLLRNDPILSKIVTDMRKALSGSIDGVSGILSDIGITTGTYEQRGKLVIDEFKLKEAIRNEPDKVKDLFIKKSSIDYSPNLTSEQRTQRYKEEGVAQRLYDIITDNIRLSRNSNGKKGTLIEKAGLVGDVSEFVNTIDSDLDKTKQRISEMNEKLLKKEDNYYKKFAAMETALNRMNQQSAWLSQQFGGGQG